MWNVLFCVYGYNLLRYFLLFLDVENGDQFNHKELRCGLYHKTRGHIKKNYWAEPNCFQGCHSIDFLKKHLKTLTEVEGKKIIWESDLV